MLATILEKPHRNVDVDRAMAWLHPGLVKRYCSEFALKRQEGEQCFIALKQFLVVCALTDEERVPSRSIDDIWHTALLFSRSYQQFCEEVLGKMVHHEPLEAPADPAAYAAARADALALFGSLSPAHWPEPGEAQLCGSKYPGDDCSPRHIPAEPL